MAGRAAGDLGSRRPPAAACPHAAHLPSRSARGCPPPRPSPARRPAWLLSQTGLHGAGVRGRRGRPAAPGGLGGGGGGGVRSWLKRMDRWCRNQRQAARPLRTGLAGPGARARSARACAQLTGSVCSGGARAAQQSRRTHGRPLHPRDRRPPACPPPRAPTHLSGPLHGSSAGQLRRQVQLRQRVQLPRRQCALQHPRRRRRARAALRLQHRQQQAGGGGQAPGRRPEEQPA